MTEESEKKEIFVNVTSTEVRAALLENGVLQEVHIERSTQRGIVSNIYKGKVSRVLPGMQAAFIDLGLERTAFLHVSDIVIPKAVEKNSDELDIKDVLHEGDDIMVQVVKDPLGNKGARMTMLITLPSRYLVLMPHGDSVGISTRIEDDDEKERLRDMVEGLLKENILEYGVIVRTAAEGAALETIAADLRYTLKLWNKVQQRYMSANVKTMIYEDVSLPLRVLRDMLSTDVERVLVDSKVDFTMMLDFASTYIPNAELILEHYKECHPIFDLHDIEDEIKKALSRNINLESGGYVIFDQTEAMNTIDVNTGGYVGHHNFEETIYRTNLEAAVVIARQLRLRNLGGIIIIDFIDMEEQDHRNNVLYELKKSLSRDQARHQIMPVSSLGLVEMTRKRTRESLQHVLGKDCAGCGGRGFVMKVETVYFEVLREIIKQSRQFEFQKVSILAHQDMIEFLLDGQGLGLTELEKQTGKSIRLQAESLYDQDQFDVVLM